jgi:hypothetical protein
VRGEIRPDKVRENTKCARKIRIRKHLFAPDPRLETGIDPFTGSIYAIMLTYHFVRNFLPLKKICVRSTSCTMHELCIKIQQLVQTVLLMTKHLVVVGMFVCVGVTVQLFWNFLDMKIRVRDTARLTFIILRNKTRSYLGG